MKIKSFEVILNNDGNLVRDWVVGTSKRDISSRYDVGAVEKISVKSVIDDAFISKLDADLGNLGYSDMEKRVLTQILDIYCN